MMNALTKAEILIEALPYIRKFSGKTVVIKYGGHAMIDPELKEKVLTDIVLMKYVGINPVIIHGGGPDINEWLAKSGIVSEFVDGLRITDKETMNIVQMVLIGKINKEIVASLQKNGSKALGLSGIDGNLIKARKMKMIKEGKELDLGLVGDVEKVDPDILPTIIEQGYIPVIAPIGVGEAGEAYNINADYVAAAVAGSLKADRLIMLTDIEGVLDKQKNLVSRLNFKLSKELMADGTISGGMIPKIECCVSALEQGVNSVHIINGTLHHALLLEIFTDSGVGTMVTEN